MGMLEKAKKVASKSASDKEHLKPDPKRKKHKAPSPAEASASGPPDSDSQPGAGAQDDSDDSQAPDPSTGGDPEQAGADSDDSSSAQPPQQPQGGGAQAPDDQGDQQDPDGPGDGGEQDDQDGPPNQGGDESGDDSDGGDQSQGGDDDSSGGDSAPVPGGVDLSKVPISPALQEEFKRCNAALMTALYTNDKVAQSVINGVVPQGPHKIESAARMATLLVVQINKQLHFVKDAPQVVMPFTQDCVTHVLDLVQQVKKIQFTEQEVHAVLGTAQEIIMRTIGVTKRQMKAAQHVLPRSQIMDGMSKYKNHLQFIKGVQGPNDKGPPGGAGAQPNPAGGAQDANAQSGAQPQGGQAPGGQPQPGAPDTAAPGPGQSAPPGGMLSQAQPPQGG